MPAVRRLAILISCLCLFAVTDSRRKLKRDQHESLKTVEVVDFDDDFDEQMGFRDGRRTRPRGPPQGEPVVTYDTEGPSLPCGPSGFKHCISKCLD
ncbi:unnamed protein product, partial [Leptidea sinapis]